MEGYSSVQEDVEPLLVLPGEMLATIEEFYAGDGVYEDKGFIYSSIVGFVVKDTKEHNISVVSTKEWPLIPRKNDRVLGIVTGIRKDIATVDVYEIEAVRAFKNPFSAILHVSETSTEYVERITNTIWIGDIIRAKIIHLKNPYPISIKNKDMGVVMAFCSKCRYPLLLKDNKLLCPICNSQEHRKVASNYFLTWGVEPRLIKHLL